MKNGVKYNQEILTHAKRQLHLGLNEIGSLTVLECFPPRCDANVSGELKQSKRQQSLAAAG